jgi:GT2 family glycosyltransferase
LGYAAGNNQAITAALENGNQPILLLNNDARIDEENMLRLLTSLDTHPKVGVIGPLLYDAENKDRLLTAGGQNMVRYLTSHISTVKKGLPLQMVDYIPGTVLLSRVDVFRTVGLLDAAYFFSGELPDWCYRARQKGYLSAVDTHARAYHTISRSSRFRETLYPYYIIRNRFLFIRKFYPHPAKALLFGFWRAYSLTLALKVQMQGKRFMAQAIRLGLGDGWQGRFGGQNERVLATCLKEEALLNPTQAEPQP